MCPVGDESVGGCGARAVSRKTPIYFWICLLSNHLFSLSEVLCIGSAAKVKDKSDNCDESYQEVPKSRGHRQVFCSSTEKLEHIGFFPHSDDICKLTKQCLITALLRLVWSYPYKLRITDSDFYMLDQRNQVYALIAMVAYCQIVDFPTWARMTGWHGGYLGTCLPPATSATGWRALQRKLVVAKDCLDTSALALQCHRDLHFQYTW